MKTKFGVTAAVLVAFCCGQALAQNAHDLVKEAKDKTKQAGEEVKKAITDKANEAMGQPAGDPAAMDPKAMMEAYEKLLAMGEEHKGLAGMVGTWETTVSMWMDPSAPAMTSTGVSVNTAMFGGRYIQQNYTGQFMGKEFQGMGYTGFNKATGKYEGVWMDSMGGSITYSSGEMAADKKSLVFYGAETDPMTKQTMKFRDVIAMVDADHHVMTRFNVLPDGKEAKTMEIKYVRKAAAPSAMTAPVKPEKK
jgi:hypothetical protein